MTAPALRIVPTVDEIRDRLGDLPRMAMPRLEDVGRQADATVDRLRGRPVRPSWLRPLLVIGVLGVLAAIGVMAMSWTRSRPGRWTDEAAIDRLDRVNEPGDDGLDGGTAADQPVMGGFGTPSLTTTGGLSLEDHEAEVR